MLNRFSYSSNAWHNLRVDGPDADGIAVIVLARSQSRNALTLPMLTDMVQLLSAMDADDSVKCIVFTGEGQFFCSGVDLTEGFGEIGKTRDTHRDAGGKLALAIHNCRKPTIAAINGTAVGVGITMTLPMSIRIAAESAKISFPFVRRGIVADAASSFYLPRLIGYGRALHLFTTGALYPAESGLLHGLFSETVNPASSTLPRALEVARDIAVNASQVGVYLTRDLIYRSLRSPEQAHLLESATLYTRYQSQDFEEGVKSFLEKRRPRFQDTMHEQSGEGVLERGDCVVSLASKPKL
ncbi:HMG-CoA hydrolase for ACT-toxin synthesis [Alternaria alternata]|uniref:Enoyl-CoA hydratase ACTT3 n=1 Tax=Alternaria alternata TaxID=5599 RepID=ACTT3_ALTAL|nr:RecName: Full=Enoyl-CoA hydratase ACTT3; AltName: Full=ACT-toxin biosynthesis protein 3 [Alternaria alternata]OWY54927.1 HMG-CoA hydrolase for ACT-toxin synthesis [Alternaria alternata]BAD93201.1 HMG-CoA hydrolase for ACT-toxin synthesis [Alternaria alternata]BAD93203.1 HMG-CoA hydrolase for ACT-toxin synthesis [Alternaria alternata]